MKRLFFEFTDTSATNYGPTLKETVNKRHERIISNARNAFNSGITKSLQFRQKQLKALLRLYTENQLAFAKILEYDLRKCQTETILTELGLLINNVNYVLRHFKAWAKPEKPSKPFVNLLDRLRIYHEPYGVVLIVASWHLPIYCSLSLVAGAIAAGNCVIVKPSHISNASSILLAQLFPRYLHKNCYQIVQGGIAETTDLLKHNFDYIFFNGSSYKGKIVHLAAAQNLTPVSLQLGGKNPVFLDDTKQMYMAARRILWGKCVNSGQTSVAPDYIICTKKVADKFLYYAEQILMNFYSDHPWISPDNCNIITLAHYERLVELIKSCKVAIGGRSILQRLYIEPTIVTGTSLDDPIMQQEIFGPILPIVTVESLEDAVYIINSIDKPLVLYIFSRKKSTIRYLISNTSSGGVCVNDTLTHLLPETLPFGGVGASGIGEHHGKYTFDMFTHKKSVLFKLLCKMQENLFYENRYPPYTEKKLAKVVGLIKYRRGVNLTGCSYLFVFLLGAAVALGLNYLVILVVLPKIT